MEIARHTGLTREMYMNCPYCNKEMSSGVIQSGSVAFFTEKERSLFLYQGFKKGDIQIVKNFWSEKAGAKKAFCCYECKKIIFDF